MAMEQDEVSREFPIREDVRVQRRVWALERIGWYVLLAVVIAALAGVFGNGPVSHRTVTSTDGRVEVEYARFSRNGAAEHVDIRVKGAPDAQVKLLLDGPMFRDLTVESMQPQPMASVSQGRALLLHLKTDADGVARLYLSLRNDSVGSIVGKARAGSGSAVRFATFVYP